MNEKLLASWLSKVFPSITSDAKPFPSTAEYLPAI